MDTETKNTKRIAKNTLVLYLRMFFLLAISLFTSRVVLQALGVDNYGIYNAVGGIVAMFSLISSSLTNSIMRFLSFELGKGDPIKLRKTFSTAINVMLLLSALLLLLGETLGLWFLNNKMNIPEDRMIAANWVLQCSILTFITSLISIPYNAAIIAHEKMNAFAYISILEALLKLLLAYALVITMFDKLICYSLYILAISIVIRLIYGIYCKRHFEECSYTFVRDRKILGGMLSFAGWNFFAQGALIVNTQGVTLLINMFFGVAVNAARGIATQINNIANQFVNNFTTAINPQITKSYATGDYEYMHRLIFSGAKFSYYLMFLIVLPICFETKEILKLWLGIVPDHTVFFVQLTLLSSMFTASNNTVITGLFATGQLKKFMLVVGIVEILNFPITYILFKLGASAEASYIIYFVIYFILIFVRLFMAKDYLHMSANEYIKKVYYPMVRVSIIPCLIVWGLTMFFQDSAVRLFGVIIICIMTSCLSIYIFGLSKEEKTFVERTILKKIFNK